MSSRENLNTETITYSIMNSSQILTLVGFAVFGYYVAGLFNVPELYGGIVGIIIGYYIGTQAN